MSKLFQMSTSAQEVTSNGFHGYDWGSKADNFQHHHGDVPLYLLEDVITPVALYWGDNDWLAAPEDILNTIMHLPNVVKGMNHEVRAWRNQENNEMSSSR
jgi:lysosomal acid lipase/cholesteryl ester hydrolase